MFMNVKYRQRIPLAIIVGSAVSGVFTWACSSSTEDGATVGDQTPSEQPRNTRSDADAGEGDEVPEDRDASKGPDGGAIGDASDDDAENASDGDAQDASDEDVTYVPDGGGEAGTVADTIVQISAGKGSPGRSYACATASTGRVYCWGSGGRLTPTPVDDLADAVEVSSGERHTCARRASGNVACWGENWGLIGDGTTEGRPLPTEVFELTDAVEISVGLRHSCARRASGAVMCWGNNDPWGMLGNGSTDPSLIPVPVDGLTDAIQIAVGFSSTCAVRITGEVVCWGKNDAGQLGDGTRVDRLTPTAVSGLTDVKQVAVGFNHACATRTDGDVWCWGGNTTGQLGNGTRTSSNTPTRASITNAAKVSAGSQSTCVAQGSGSVLCWGSGASVGDGVFTAHPYPTIVANIFDAVETSVGVLPVCARLASGEVRCWGDNRDGAIGTGTTNDQWTPAPVIGLPGSPEDATDAGP